MSSPILSNSIVSQTNQLAITTDSSSLHKKIAQLSGKINFMLEETNRNEKRFALSNNPTTAKEITAQRSKIAEFQQQLVELQKELPQPIKISIKRSAEGNSNSPSKYPRLQNFFEKLADKSYSKNTFIQKIKQSNQSVKDCETSDKPPLTLAAIKGNLPLMEALISLGATINNAQRENFQTTIITQASDEIALNVFTLINKHNL